MGLPPAVVSIMLDHRFGVWLWGSTAAVAAAAGPLLFLYASAREKDHAETL